MRLLVAAGASAGHVYPSLSFAQKLTQKYPSLELAFVTAQHGSAKEWIKKRGYKVFLISIRPFQYSFWKFFPWFYCFLRSFLESFFIIEKFRPEVVIGFGSYVSFPIVLEAALLKKFTIIHEQNVSLGGANKFLSHFVDKVALSFKTGAPPSKKEVYTGYPLGDSLRSEDKEKARKFFGLDDKITILALGGSQGSLRINNEFKKAVTLLEKKEDFQFIHLSGKKDYFDLKKNYSYTTIKHCVFDFLSEMALAYSLADIVVARAGAGTIAELSYFKKAAILIPYPYAGAHQVENARALEKENAAIVIEEKDLERISLSDCLVRLMQYPHKRKELEEQIGKFAPLSAAEDLVNLALSY